jgi:hypothetical protein
LAHVRTGGGVVYWVGAIRHEKALACFLCVGYGGVVTRAEADVLVLRAECGVRVALRDATRRGLGKPYSSPEVRRARSVLRWAVGRRERAYAVPVRAAA